VNLALANNADNRIIITIEERVVDHDIDDRLVGKIGA